MAPKSTLVPFPPSPVRRSNGAVSDAASAVPANLRVLIVMLARRAARQDLDAEVAALGRHTEPDPR